MTQAPPSRTYIPPRNTISQVRSVTRSRLNAYREYKCSESIQSLHQVAAFWCKIDAYSTIIAII